MQLASEIIEDALLTLRASRVNYVGNERPEESAKLSVAIVECEKWLTEATEREASFLTYEQYQQAFRAKHIQPFLDACPQAAEAVERIYDEWLSKRQPGAKTTSAIESELDDARETLATALEEDNLKMVGSALRVILPLTRRIETNRLKTGYYVGFSDVADTERQLGEQIIEAAYKVVTGRAIRLRHDTGKYSVGGFVRIDADYHDEPDWFNVCDSIDAEAAATSNVLKAIYNSSLTVPSRWAAARIKLYIEGDLIGYGTQDFPWAKDILDARGNPGERGTLKLYFLKPTQVGGSTSCFIRVLFELDYRGRDSLVYVPDESAARKLNLRLQNLIDSSDYLKGRVDATSETKSVGMATLYIEGARGITARRSTPAAVIFIDEFDLIAPEHAEEITRRLTGAKHGLELCVSTPSTPGCGIDALVERYQAQREHFVSECPYCLSQITLDYPSAFHREGEFENDPLCNKSYVQCPKCESKLDPATKQLMLADGRWELVDPTQVRTNTRVFQGLNHLYSSVVTAEDFARASLRTGEAAVKEFNNSNLGRTYVEARGQIYLATLLKAISPNYSMGDAKPSLVNLDGPPRLLLIDQGRPHSAVVVEYRVGKREDWHSSHLDRYQCRVLWAEKVYEKIRLDELAFGFGVWSCIIDADPDNTLPGFLLHNPNRHLHSHGYVVAARALDNWNTPSGIETPEIGKDDTLPRLAFVNIHRTQYYAAAIRRTLAGNLVLPSDISNGFIEECQNVILTHIPDPTGSPRLYARARDGKPHDFLSCLQLGEVGLELLSKNRIGVVVRMPETFRI
jgi:hypothetical protein